jgi:hypothetical protein
MYRLVAVGALLGLPLTVRADEVPSYSLRELALRADTIVLADALTPIRPTRFHVRAVLRGRGAREGEMLTFADMGPVRVESFDPPSLPREGPRPRRINQALLFLEPSTRGANRRQPRLVPSGLRFVTIDQRVLVPSEGQGRELKMVVAPSGDWSSLLVRVKTDVASLEQLDHARRLARPSARARSLLAWVERHRRQFGADLRPREEKGPAGGWGRLEREVFEWALACGSPAECWSAVKLYAELNRGTAPPLPAGCSLTTAAGRALLLEEATRASALRGDRMRALTLLARPPRPLTAPEHQAVLERLVAVLAERDAPLRSAVARAIVELSPATNGARERAGKLALPHLVRLYKEEAPGPTRDELAESVYALGGPEHWRALTGSPSGVLVCLRDLEKSEAQLRFWLSLRGNGRFVHEQPVIVLERINLLGGAAETKRLPLTPANLPRPWAEGWDGADLLFVEVPLKGLTAGNWRVTVHGTVGKDKQKWVAEARKFVVTAPKGPGPYFPRRKGW